MASDLDNLLADLNMDGSRPDTVDLDNLITDLGGDTATGDDDNSTSQPVILPVRLATFVASTYFRPRPRWPGVGRERT